MWKLYVILVLWTQLLNAQYDVYSTKRREGDGIDTLEPAHIHSDYSYNKDLTRTNNNNTITYSDHQPRRNYNKNSVDSFGNTHVSHNNTSLSHTKETDVNMQQQNANTQIVSNLSTKSPIVDEHQFATQISKAGKIPTADYFNSKLFEVMTLKGQHENLVFSPISLQTLLAFILTMSDGKLYEELAQLLAISSERSHVAKTFEDILQTLSLYESPTMIVLANKVYYDYRFGPINYSVRSSAKKSFASEMEQIDFLSSKSAANIINSWISELTQNRLQDIVTPSSISGDTSALILNSIYFKSEWLIKFATYDTEPQDFFITKRAKVPVDMMYNEDIFRYADFPEMNASVVELPYKTSNLSMILILPKDIEGVGDLERTLRFYDVNLLSQRLKRETVTIKLPKFKFEYETDLIKPLQEMGLNHLFNNAGSIKLIKNQQKPFKIDQFKHKSFINVNEAGTEAAATTVAKYVPLSIPIDMKYFIADHPFIFFIRNSNTIFFIGHVVHF